MSLKELSLPDVPGDKVRLKLLQQGAEFERERILDELRELMDTFRGMDLQIGVAAISTAINTIRVTE